MMFLHRLFKDKTIAAGLAVFLVYLVMLQGVFGLVAQAAIAADPLAGAHVLCSSMGADVRQPAQDKPHTPQDCLCTALCRLAAQTAVLANTADDAGTGVSAFYETAYPGYVVVRVAHFEVLEFQPRGPPLFS